MFSPLDIGFSRPRHPDLFARSTLRLTRRAGEPATLASHAYPFLTSTDTLEAEFSGIRRRRFDEKYAEAYEVAVYRFKALEPAAAEAAVCRLEGIRYRGYSFPKIALQLVDLTLGLAIGRDVWVARRLGLFSSRFIICSWAAGVAGSLVDMWAPRPTEWAKMANPDDLLDHMQERPEAFDLVHSTPGFFEP